MIYELDNKELIFNLFLFIKYYIHEEIIGKVFKISFSSPLCETKAIP